MSCIAFQPGNKAGKYLVRGNIGGIREPNRGTWQTLNPSCLEISPLGMNSKIQVSNSRVCNTYFWGDAPILFSWSYVMVLNNVNLNFVISLIRYYGPWRHGINKCNKHSYLNNGQRNIPRNVKHMYTQLNIAFININGQTDSKLAHIYDFVHVKYISVLGIVEHKQRAYSKGAHLPGYVRWATIREQYVGKGGGVVVYVKQDLKVEKIGIAIS